MIKIIEVKERSNGLDVIVDINKQKLYPFLKSIYNIKRGSKKLVERFLKEAILNYNKEK